jgi:hypothetical protein
MIDLVPPTRPGGPSAEAAALRAAGVRAVLRIAVGQRGTISRYNPPAYFGDPFFPYGDPWYGGYAFPGPVVGGTWVQEPAARYEATLQEAQGGAVIWKGEAVTRGGASADFSDLAARAAKDLVARLQQDGVI